MSKTLTLASVSLAATLLQDIASNHPKDISTKVNSITWTPSVDILKEEGLVLSDSGDDNLSDSQKMAKVVENGISYVVWMEGQKIGFYADQRENCQYISSISKGQKVLDICCYTGGFALNAASGGALSVIGIAKCIWDVQEFKFPGYTINKKRRTVNNLLMWGAASIAGRKITIVPQAGVGCDYPVNLSYLEGQYLSNVLLRVL